MPVFLEEVGYANSVLLESVWREQERAKAIRDGALQLQTAARTKHNVAFSLDLGADTINELVAGHDASDILKRGILPITELEDLWQRAKAHETSLAALSGAVLQICHSGIRLVHGSREACPPGRLVGPISLRDVIWYGRNQAAHWEDTLHDTTRAVFDALKTVDPGFNDYTKKNMAFKVVSFLGWRTQENLSRDMSSLA